MMLASRSTVAGSYASTRRNPAARAAAVDSTPLAPAPTANHGALRDAEHIEAQAAFSASLERVIGAHKGALLLEAPLCCSRCFDLLLLHQSKQACIQALLVLCVETCLSYH